MCTNLNTLGNSCHSISYILIIDHCCLNRVKSLSKSGNAKKDQGPVSLLPTSKESSSAQSLSVSVDEPEDVLDQNQEMKVVDIGGRFVEKESLSYSSANFDRQPSSLPSNYPFNGKEECGVASASLDKDRTDMKNTYGGSTSHKLYSSVQNSNDRVEEEKVQKVSPPRRKVFREEKSEKQGNWPKKDGGTSDLSTTSYKQQHTYNSNINNVGSKQYEPEAPGHDGDISAILEVKNWSYPLLALIFFFLFIFLTILS